jgi:gamma-glutamylcyclotransferase (GGCT)/AIG2-like uncharacterized protein YtfP
MRNINVFVYGTLLSAGANPAERMVDAEVVTGAKVPGVIYDLGWYPGFKQASALDDPSDVFGELIKVDEEGIERLDAYEGAPSLYTRAETTVQTNAGEFVPAFVYVYNGNVHDDDRIVGGNWLDYEKEND